MGITLQKTMRILTPGIIILVLGLITFGNATTVADLWAGKIAFSTSTITIYSIFVFVLGFLHHEFIRPEIMNPIWRDIDQNLKKGMIQTVNNIASADAVKVLLSDNRLIRTFFTIIDSNPTLVNSSERVRFNGYILTTAVDVEILFFIFAFLNLLLLKNHHSPARVMITIVLFLGSYFGKKLEQRFKEKHLALGNEQLNEILRHHRTEFDKRLNEHFLS